MQFKYTTFNIQGLLGIEKYESLLGHPVVGTSWEGFVIENLLASAPARTQASFYRTAAGAEIDLVLDLPRRGRWAIEIKRGLAPRPEKGFYLAVTDVEPKRSFIVHAGDDRYPVRADLEAIGLREMIQVLRDAAQAH